MKAAPWLAAGAYGGWAAYSHWEFARSVIITAFAIQGGFAFSSTWLLNASVLWMIGKQQPTPKPVLTFCICFAALLAIPVSLHLAAGSPNMWQAILPGLTIGSAYAAWVIRASLKY